MRVTSPKKISSGKGPLLWKLGFTIGLLTNACGQSKDDATSVTPANTDCAPQIGEGVNSKGLLFSAVSSDYQSSSTYFLDFASGCLRTLLTGQSGDPKITLLDGDIYLFNRSATDNNFLNLQWQAGTFLQGTQLSNPLPGFGDPSDVIEWKNAEFLALARSDKSLSRIDLLTGELRQRVSSENLDTAGQPFFPNALIRQQTAAGDIVYVVHSYFDTYDDHQVFLFREDENQQLVAVDLDPEKELVQGFATHFTNPSRVLYRDTNEPLIVSLCTTHAKEGCRGGVDVFDLESGHLLNFQDSYGLYDFSATPGLAPAQHDVIEGAGEREFFLRVSQKDETQRKIIHVKPLYNSFRIKHEYEANTTGETAMFYEKAADLFIVGEGLGADKGRLVAYLANGERLEFEFVGMPYTGVLVP
ncbi:MAG: hypothetical protein ACOH5I_21670 [Oligoflexus sp.]